MSNKKHFEYDVALSFAGEDRNQAEALARLLRRPDVQVFYDEFHKATLWGKDLFQHLEKVYRDKARYCVVFVSRHYLKKNWTKHELRQAQARSFESAREYILPLRLDDTVLPGLAATIGYLDLRKTKIEQVAALLLEKLGKQVSPDVERANWSGERVEYHGMRVASFWPEVLEAAQRKPLYLVTQPHKRIPHGSERYWKKKRLKPFAMIARHCRGNITFQDVTSKNARYVAGKASAAVVSMKQSMNPNSNAGRTLRNRGLSAYDSLSCSRRFCHATTSSSYHALRLGPICTDFGKPPSLSHFLQRRARNRKPVENLFLA